MTWNDLQDDVVLCIGPTLGWALSMLLMSAVIIVWNLLHI